MKVQLTRFTTTIAVAAALGATAVPALALENEFHGMFRVRGIVSNLDDYRSAFFDATDGSGTAKPLGNPGTRSYIEQRARLLYIAKANDDLKLHTHFEVDSRWGDSSYAVGRNQGGAIGADSVNLETKNVYLDFNIPSTPLNVKVGIQPFADSLKGIFVNADAAGALATARFASGEAAAGYFRFDDKIPAGSTSPGRATRDFFVLDGKYSLSKEVRVGASYYGVLDDRSAGFKNQIHTIGVNAETKVGPAVIDGFFAYQTGEVGSAEQDLRAFAGNVGTKVKTGIGTARANFLYVSGDGSPGSGSTRNDFQTIGSPGTENNFFAAETLLLLPHKTSINTYRGIIWDLNNRSQGVIGGFIGYDANLTDKLFASATAGFAATARNNANKPAGSSNSRYLGTELSGEIGYKLYPNLTASVQGGYVFLGDYFKGTAVDEPGKDPAEPYTARVVLSFLF